MKISYGFRRLAPWINFPASVLAMILQRTPAPRVVALFGDILEASPFGSFLKAAVVLEGSLGAMHTLAGATTVSVTDSTPQPSLSTSVNVPVTGVAFGIIPSGYAPSSWTVAAGSTIPQGMFFHDPYFPGGKKLSGPGTINVVNGVAVLDGTPTATGSFTLTVVAYYSDNGQGAATAPFPYTVNVTGAPVFTTQPASQSVNAGASVTLSAAVAGATSYQWQFGGANISGAINSSLTLANIGATQAGSYGSYTVTATNQYGSATSSAATLTISANSFLYNISTRGYVGSSPYQDLDAGFYVQGSGSKNILIRGDGPYLALNDPKDFTGVTLVSPELTFNNAGGTLLTNTAWGGGQTLVNAFNTVFAPVFASNSNDSAIFMNVSANGSVGYTADVTSATLGGTGVAQVEVDDYDAFNDYVNNPSSTPASHLINISTRGYVGASGGLGGATGANAYQYLDAGFYIFGSTSQTLLIRAVGPAEAANFPGQNLASPTLTLYDVSGKIIATNTGWGSAPAPGNSTVAAGIQPATTAIMNSVYASTIAPGSADCAMVVTLPSSTGYTAEVTSANHSSAGIALVEVYNVPPQ